MFSIFQRQGKASFFQVRGIDTHDHLQCPNPIIEAGSRFAAFFHGFQQVQYQLLIAPVHFVRDSLPFRRGNRLPLMRLGGIEHRPLKPNHVEQLA